MNELLCSSLCKSKRFTLFSFLLLLKKNKIFQIHGGGKTPISGFGNLFGELYFCECYFFLALQRSQWKCYHHIYVKGKFLDLANPTNNVKELWMPNWKLLKVIFFDCVHKYSVNKGGGLHPIFSLALIIFKGQLNLSNLDLIFNGKSNFQYLPEGKEKRWLINFKGIDYDQYLQFLMRGDAEQQFMVSSRRSGVQVGELQTAGEDVHFLFYIYEYDMLQHSLQGLGQECMGFPYILLNVWREEQQQHLIFELLW